MTYTAFLIKGLSGSGKSHLARRMSTGYGPVDVCSADTYFLKRCKKTGRPLAYEFDASKLGEAHAQCLEMFKASFRENCVAVANTFSCRWEMQPYIDHVANVGGNVVVIDLYDAGLTDCELAERNTHDVPRATISAMRARYEHDWQNGDPLPPWERAKVGGES